MSTSNNIGSLNTTGIGFESLKQSFRQYLSQQTAFKDWNFEGSNISTLLDVLTYNTVLNISYLNMLSGEMFLDSAQLRESIVSRAKELDYCPMSRTSASVTLSVSLTGNNIPGIVTLPAGFSVSGTRADDTSLNFITATPAVLTSGNDWTANVTFYEGRLITETFVKTTAAGLNDQFNIQSANVDTTSIVVTVTPVSSNNAVTWSRAPNIIKASSATNVWFLQGYLDNYYQVAFGDGNIGTALNTGDVVTVTYRETSGDAGNGLTSFSTMSGVAGLTQPVVVNIDSAGSISAGGSERQSNSSIQLAAPRSYTAQIGAITANDYSTIIESQFPQLSAVCAYGGEVATPQKQFGTVVISAKLAGLNQVPVTLVNSILAFVAPLAPLGISVNFEQPDVYNASIQCEVTYDAVNTTLSSVAIQNAVTSAILAYDADSLETFGGSLYYSELIGAISAADPSIVGVTVGTQVVKNVAAVDGAIFSTNFAINNAVLYPFISQSRYPPNYDSPVTSSIFTYAAKASYFYDSGDGLIRVAVVANGHTPADTVVGSIDYTTAQINIVTLQPVSNTGGVIAFYLQLANDDIIASNQSILSILPAGINVTVAAL